MSRTTLGARRRRTAAVAALTTALALAGGATADAETYRVDTEDDDVSATCTGGDDCSLRGAITTANTEDGRDTIEVPAGRYRLTIEGSGEDENQTGDLDVLDDLEIEGDGAGRTTVEGFRGDEDEDRVFDLAPSIDCGDCPFPEPGIDTEVRIDGLSIVEGSTTGLNDDGFGGGVRSSATAVLRDVAVRNNFASSDGGGVRNDGEMLLERVELSENLTNGFGGGMVNNFRARLINVTAAQNQAGISGGGIAALAFSQIPARGDGPSDASTLIESSTIAGNRIIDRRDRGGEGGGGGEFVFRSANLASGDPIWIELRGERGRGSQMQVRNSIVADPGPGEENCTSFGISSLGGNLEHPGDSCMFTEESDDQDHDPELGELRDNGGPTKTRALDSGSPAIDEANADNLPEEDQRGVSRVQGDGGDKGAFEREYDGPSDGTNPPPIELPVTQEAQSVAPPIARTCLSRRAFVIRLGRGLSRSITLTSARVKVAGKSVPVREANGRLTTTIDLQKLPQTVVTVTIVAKGDDGKTYRGTRRYRTCRVGKNGPPVRPGSGSTIVPVG